MRMLPPARVTTAHIARHLGISATTVRHVLNGNAERVGIREETRQRVLDAVRELNYRPNTSARAISTGRQGSIALLQPYRAIYLPSRLLLGLSDALERRGLHMSLARLGDAALGDPNYLPKVVREITADGLLLNVISHVPDAIREAIRAHAIPTVWINSRQDVDCVHPDDLGGGRLATEHLLSLGHERIVFFKTDQPVDPFFGPSEAKHYSEADRFQGYADAMRAAGLAPRRMMLPPVPYSHAQLLADRRLEAATTLLAAPDRPTAVIAYESDEAFPIWCAAARLGLSIPGDLSLIMFHEGIDFSFPAPITTMELNLEELGRQAVDALVTKIADPDSTIPPRAVPVQFFEGGTCAPPCR